MGRNLEYGELAMLTTDVNPAADANIVTACTGHAGTQFVDPDGPTGPLKCEPVHAVASTASPAITQHVTTETIGGLDFTLKRYVTWVDADAQGGTDKDYKRLIAMVEWTTGGTAGTYRTSTLVTDARRGKKVPSFDLTPSPKAAEGLAEQAKAVQRGFRVVFAHSIKNLGLPDTYDLVHTDGPQSPPRTWATPCGAGLTGTCVSFHKDLNGNGEYDAATESAPLTNTKGLSAPDTGQLATNQVLKFLSVWTLPTSDPVGIEMTSLKAASTLDPDLYEIRTDKLQITDAPIPLTLNLHNRPSPPIGNTVAQTDLTMDVTAPATTQLFQYSTDVSGGNGRPGRLVRVGTAGASEADKSKMVNWVHAPASRLTLKGNAILRAYIVNLDLSCVVGSTFHTHLRNRPVGSGTTSLVGSSVSTTVGILGCPLQEVTYPINTETIIDVGRQLELKLTVPSGIEPAFAYDTTSYAATLTIPQVTAVIAP